MKPIILNDDNVDLIKMAFINRLVKDYYNMLTPTPFSKFLKRPIYYYKEELRRIKELRFIEHYVTTQDFKSMFDIDGVKLIDIIREKYKRGIKPYETNNTGDLYDYYMGFR